MTDAAPINVITALGLGPLGEAPVTDRTLVRRRLDRITASTQGVIWSIDTAGLTAQRLLTVLVELDGAATADQLAEHTAGADQTVIADTIDRLTRLGHVVPDRRGGLRLATDTSRLLRRTSISIADPQAITSDVLAVMCRRLGVKASNRKQDRIDAIAAAFADPEERARIRASLSRPARDLLDRIAATGRLGVVEPEAVGLQRYLLYSAQPSRYGHIRSTRRPEVEPLGELADHGIVGIAPWDEGVWIWREARPLADVPLVPDWHVAPAPPTTSPAGGPARLPEIVHVLDRGLDIWAATPTSVLKSGEPRLAKTTVRSTAKRIGADEDLVDLAARLAISIGLLHPHTTGMSGRGRNRRAERVWQPDPALVTAWRDLPAAHRWSRLVAEWCRPRLEVGTQLLINRHLLLWELTRLAPDVAWDGPDESICAWFADHYATLGHPIAASECLTDLRLLGVVTTGDAVALSSAGRLLLDAPDRLAEGEFGGATDAVVQPDFTVVAPPDLDVDLLTRLRTIAELVTDGGALVFRLQERSIIRAVQAGDDADGIVDFLRELSSVPIADTVERLVRDAASRAHGLAVHDAASVIVVDDPADLATACSIKSAKLTRLTDTVATSLLPPAKLLSALDRRGLHPHIAGTAGRPPGEPATRGAPPPRTTARDDRLVVPGRLTATPRIVDDLVG